MRERRRRATVSEVSNQLACSVAGNVIGGWRGRSIRPYQASVGYVKHRKAPSVRVGLRPLCYRREPGLERVWAPTALSAGPCRGVLSAALSEYQDRPTSRTVQSYKVTTETECRVGKQKTSVSLSVAPICGSGCRSVLGGRGHRLRTKKKKKTAKGNE